MSETASYKGASSNQGLLMRPKTLTLALMAGLPGSGKTTIAYELAQKLQWMIVDKDEYRSKYLKQGLDREYAANKAYKQSFDEIHTALIREQTSVIFDSAALHSFIIEAVDEIISQDTNIRLKTILCVIDRQERHKRLDDRKKDDITDTFDPLTENEYLARFEHLRSTSSELLILRTNRPLQTCIDEARDFLKDR